nr:MAG TPA: hypothetical protein [Caudoviricetes sp.]
MCCVLEQKLYHCISVMFESTRLSIVCSYVWSWVLMVCNMGLV